MSNASPISLEQLFRYYKALPHQAAAIAELQNDLRANGYDAAMRRDRPWFSTWSQDGKQADLAPALKLIKEFEGCHLEAYADPLHGWDVATIGYGTTRYGDGRKVQKGDKINAVEADMLLRQEIDWIAAKLGSTVPHWKEMGDCQKSALISFSYNLGSGFYGTSGFKTISAALAEKRWKDVPAAMLLYRNPGTNVEAGLKRRREAEGKLWLQDMAEMPAEPVRIAVPYFSQRDNASGTGYRECFSSSCAMVAAFYGKVKTDDEYNKIRSQFGDTIEPTAQLKTLQSLGLKARFIQNCTVAMLETELRAGKPVAVGWLHQGTAAKPSGGGHWSVAIGFNPTQIVHNDPYGECDMINGGYINSNGAAIGYSRKNWLRRWEADGAGTGWAMLISK